jgi:predicted ATP-grasp superfamily ATP-dependent carboligase
MAEPLLIVGASGRAAAASALRAGFDPFVIDLFADADTKLLCPVLRCPFDQYPHGFIELAKQAPPGPWMYTGGLENHPDVVTAISEHRPLWGNRLQNLVNVRDPFRLYATLTAHGIRCPRVCPSGYPMPEGQRWLAKRFQSGGGQTIAEYDYFAKPRTVGEYAQEFVPGAPASALFVSMPWRFYFLGAASQLIGTSWLHAKPFEYAGNIAPISLAPAERDFMTRLGWVVTQYGPKFGFFGVDLIRTDDLLVPIEVNPRYTASVELYELASGVASLQWQTSCKSCLDDDADPDAEWSEPIEFEPSITVGKGIYYAAKPIPFPASGPWDESLANCTDVWRRPDYADIPEPGTLTEPGQPVLTIFAEAATEAECVEQLKRQAAELDQLFGVPTPAEDEP